MQREDVVALLKEVIDAVHADSGLAGIHCCGNTEWSILIDAGVDIVNFDAFEFGETIAMYGKAVKEHLQRGGMLAWGVVPTSVAIREQTVETPGRPVREGAWTTWSPRRHRQAADPRAGVHHAVLRHGLDGGGGRGEGLLLLGQTSKALRAKYKFA